MIISRDGGPILSREELVKKMMECAIKFKKEDPETYNFMIDRAKKLLEVK